MYLRSRGRRFKPERDLTPAAPWARPDSHWMRIGRYHELLSRYCDIFPRHKIHVFLFDDMQRSPENVVHAMYQFLGVDSTFVPDFATPHNFGGVPGSMALERFYTSKAIKTAVEPWIPRRAANRVRRLRSSNLHPAPPLPSELRKELAPHFHDEILRTAELVGRDLDDWL